MDDTLELNCSIPDLALNNQHRHRTTLHWLLNAEPVDKQYIVNYFNFSLLGLRLPLSSIGYDVDELDIDCISKQYRFVDVQPRPEIKPKINTFSLPKLPPETLPPKPTPNASLITRIKQSITDDQKDWITSLQVSLIPFGIVAAFFVLR